MKVQLPTIKKETQLAKQKFQNTQKQKRVYKKPPQKTKKFPRRICILIPIKKFINSLCIGHFRF